MHPFDVDQQAALVVAADLYLEALAFLEALLQDAPALLAARPVHREEHLPLRRFRLHDVDEDVVAGPGPVLHVRPERVHLARRDDAL